MIMQLIKWTWVLPLLFGLFYVVGLNMIANPNNTGPRALASLQFLIVVCRHGNRAPLFTYPTYPYPGNNREFWPYGEAQLTGKGREQMFRLGSKVRYLYDGFLSDKYFKEDFKAFSTAVDRTMMSGQAFLAGLFPPKDFQVWNDRLLWQPVPLFTTTLDHTQLLAEDPSKLCPRFAEAQRKSMARFYVENEANITSFIEALSPYTHLDLSSTTGAFALRRLWDPLICAYTEGLPLPAWSIGVFPSPLDTYMTKAEVASTIGSDEMIRLLQGQLFQEMVGLIQAKANGSLTPDRRMFLYSGHDMTIRGLQGILGLKDSGLVIVRPGSALMLELHRGENTSDYFLQVVYIDGGTTDLDTSQVSVPGCGTYCPLDAILNLTQKYYNITDYEAECQLNK